MTGNLFQERIEAPSARLEADISAKDRKIEALEMERDRLQARALEGVNPFKTSDICALPKVISPSRQDYLVREMTFGDPFEDLVAAGGPGRDANGAAYRRGFISHNVLIKWFQKVNAPIKIVQLLFAITNWNIKLTVLWES